MSWDEDPDDYLDNLGVDRYEFHGADLLGWKNPGPFSLTADDGELIHPSDERWEELNRRRTEERRLKEKAQREARQEEREREEREWYERYWEEKTVGMTEEEKEQFRQSTAWTERHTFRVDDLPF